jgi:glutamine amidotransferase
VGLQCLNPQTAADLDGCRAIVVPGVGHFSATAPLDRRFKPAILSHVRAGRPLLGICLGLQWLYDGSDEAPSVPGLGVIPGSCFRLSGNVKVPHVGWNTLETRVPAPILNGLENAAVYFTHSYAAPVTPATVAITTHGVPFASVVQHDRVIGVQWHPEKSGEAGLALLKNFAEMAAAC